MSSVTIPERILVHKEGEEGTIEIQGSRGVILTPIMERPPWAEGLVYGVLSERHRFYEARLGAGYTGEMRFPNAMAYEDLTWIGLNDEAEEVTVDYSPEFRQEYLANLLGVDREEGTVSNAVAEAEIDMQNERTKADAELIDQAMRTTFGEADAAVAKKETGTG